MAKLGRGADQFPLRLPDGMREQIKRIAEENGRSMNAEIVDVLREYFPADPDLSEVRDQLEYAVALMRSIEKSFAEDGAPPPGSLPKALGAALSAVDDLEKIAGKEKTPTVASLSGPAVAKLAEVGEAYALKADLLRSTISDLMIMGADQVLRKESRLKVHIGEGDAQHVIEMKFPDEV